MATQYTILKGDCRDKLKELPDNSVDSIVTDPPYGLSKEPDIFEVLTKWMNGEPYDHGHGGFMGKTWDSFVPHPDIWREVYRVLKPGGHSLVFAGTRTQDLMTIALRLAGFEVRDVIEWLYFSGFPKSMDVSKAFDRRAGVEREVIGQKWAERYPNGPGGNSFTVGGEVDGTRTAANTLLTAPATELAKKWGGWGTALKPAHEPIIVVRKPLEGTVCDNVERWGTGAINVDGCRIGDGYDRASGGLRKAKHAENEPSFSLAMNQDKRPMGGRFPANIVTTESDAFWSKYCDVTATQGNVTPQELSKKASKRDRNSDWRGEEIASQNSHPTVKPTELMAWLVSLVTPPGGTVLDPFAGSGSTLVAAKREGFGFIGIEREPEYVEIIEVRTGEVAN
ncbi:DNA-methyltransferase [Heyndrickxia coagulans]|uniref:DNA-methyltransferase n=1 Tax=Heyndrickxia coagulans TaxID=1398 RepID=UPI000793E28B|nr:site-specific DNA-methyltransferase [Heyndrickxia coagulans]KYC67187.1 Adenine-specific methyltransferase [Heyndrickxia coagulans]